jgi:hypothetical protein
MDTCTLIGSRWRMVDDVLLERRRVDCCMSILDDDGIIHVLEHFLPSSMISGGVGLIDCGCARVVTRPMG